ncbi:alanine racemase [Marinobacteraceae bacterium S3BR75-40.1]
MRDVEAGLARLAGIANDRVLPAALLDLAALESNARWLLTQAGDKRIRIVTKSVRCVEALRFLQGLDDRFAGLMCFDATEACWLSTRGFSDLLVAYPCTDESVLAQVCEFVAAGADITLMVDSLVHLEMIESAAASRNVTVAVCLDIDMSTPFGPLWFGVRRSPLRQWEQVRPLLDRIAASDELKLAGVMGYEAQIAGIPDRTQGKRLQNLAVPRLKALAWPWIQQRRNRVIDAIVERGERLDFVNGGGTGSIQRTAADPSVTEIAVGSGFFAPHLFDGYSNLDLRPAALFATRVVRSSDPGWVTVAGGGYVASGAPGWDRQPWPAWPPGLALDDNEGAGEVQTPLQVTGAASVTPKTGEPVLFRHAKAGELCERFNQLLAIDSKGDVLSWGTYRGDGQCFL